MSCNKYNTASFNGVQFEILPVTYSGGRRVSTHTYPFAEYHYNEDLGREPEKFSVTGCFHGKDFRDKFQIAKRVWSLKIDGVYFDPTLNRGFPCRLVSWSYKLDHKKVDYIEFTLELVESANNPYPSNIIDIFGKVNNIIDEYISIVSDVYVKANQIVGSVQNVTDGLKAGYEYLDGSVRMVMPSSGYVGTKSRIVSGVNKAESITPGTTKTDMAKDNIEAVLAVQEEAVKTAPASFFKMGSEVRTKGSILQEAQTQLIAQTSLAYYLEKVSDDADFKELKNFRERAIAIKEDAQDTLERVKTEKLQFAKPSGPSICATTKEQLIDSLQELIAMVDDMIVQAGNSITHTPTYTYKGTHNALVASYHLFGDISRATEIMELSGGVSGSKMSRVVYHQ